MFTGIVTDIGRVASAEQLGDIRRLTLTCRYDPTTIEIGASIACGGVCQTVVARVPSPEGAEFTVEAAPETLAVTTVAEWTIGSRVNLERSLRVGDEIGGHLVSGHVDGVARITDRHDLDGAVRFTFEAPPPLARFIAVKGSVALDGTSLTVNRVENAAFDCLLIPHTLKVTTWGERRPGDAVNIEVDTLARYVARLTEADAEAAPIAPPVAA